jgi:hypothetical protein
MAYFVRSMRTTRAKPAHGHQDAHRGRCGGEAQAPHRQARRLEGIAVKAAHAEGKKRRAEYLRSWSLYVGQLLFAEAERR